MLAFASLPLDASLLRAVEVLGFTSMTPVQAATLPGLLAGRDLIGLARTGSGKTAAFGLALLNRLDVDSRTTQALVLCPTRELADQVSAELRRLARFVPNLRVVTLCGGVPVRTQVPSLEHPPHVVVGTPGRILDHLRRETLEFGGLKTFVLDEADRMLDLGFLPAISDVAATLPARRQTMLFSATMPDDIRGLGRRLLQKPLEVSVDADANPTSIRQTFFTVPGGEKLAGIERLLAAHAPASTLIFCHTRKDTRDVTEALRRAGHDVLALHGELEQRQRDEVLIRFANGSARILVATDVAARGLDIKELGAVISFELPHDVDMHQHRVGRTGRAGQTGQAFHLVAPEERDRVPPIEAVTGPAHFGPLPTAEAPPVPAAMVTIQIDGGVKDKLRKGDILGALTGDCGLPGDAVGRIDSTPGSTFVAITREHVDAAVNGLTKHPIKGRRFRLRRLDLR